MKNLNFILYEVVPNNISIGFLKSEGLMVRDRRHPWRRWDNYLGQRTMWCCRDTWVWEGPLDTETSRSNNLEILTTKFSLGSDITIVDFSDWSETGTDRGVPKTIWEAFPQEETKTILGQLSIEEVTSGAKTLDYNILNVV